MWRTKSLTVTLSLIAWVSVPSQRSAIVQIVPRTVAAAYLPLVRNLPWALECRSCRVLLEDRRDSLALLGLAAGEAGRPLERVGYQRDGRQARTRLGDLEHGAAELAGLGLDLGLLLFLGVSRQRRVLGPAGRDQRQSPVERIDDRPIGDLAELRQRHEHAVQLDQHQPGRRDVEALAAIGGPGAPSLSVLNTTSGPNVVPSPFLATSRTW